MRRDSYQTSKVLIENGRKTFFTFVDKAQIRSYDERDFYSDILFCGIVCDGADFAASKWSERWGLL